jgi:hypothetical protein
VRLNAGCGGHYVDGWVNADADPAWADQERNPGGRLDVVADIRALPFPAYSVHSAMASHVFEHLAWPDEVIAAATDLGRVLVPAGEGQRGKLLVVCPDIERAVMCGEPHRLLEQIIAWPQEWNPDGRYPEKTPPSGHAWTATSGMLAWALEQAGLAIEQDCSGRLTTTEAAGWPVPDKGAWQCAFIAYSPLI